DLVLDVTQEAPQTEPGEARDRSEHDHDERDHERVEAEHELRERDQYGGTAAAYGVGNRTEGSDGRQLHHEVDEREQNLGDVVESTVDLFAATFGDREDPDADHHREDDDLEQLALGERADEVVGHDVHDELDEALRRRLGGRGRDRRRAGGGHSLADLDQVPKQQTEHQCDRRNDLEIDDRAPADTSGALHVAGGSNAVHDGEEHERRDPRLDQREEHVAQQLELRGELRNHEANDDAEDQRYQHLHAPLAVPRQLPRWGDRRSGRRNGLHGYFLLMSVRITPKRRGKVRWRGLPSAARVPDS